MQLSETKRLPRSGSAQSAVLRSLRTALLGALSLFVAFAPGSAWALRADSDQIAGLPLTSCDPSHTVAPDISAFSGALCTSDGRILWSRRLEDERAMASTTKIMTALLTLERSDLDEIVVVSKRASSVPYAAGLHAGERLSVRQLLEFALVISSNDAATALAEHVSGSVPAFAAEMNDRARQLGLDSTRFANPHGLDAPGHHTSAADLLALTRTAMALPEFRRITSLKKVTLPAHEDRSARTVKSTHLLLRSYQGSLGGKTGFTNDAKYSLVTSAERDGVALTAVILGAPSSTKRFKHSARLLDWGFKHLRVKTLATATETVGAVSLAPNPSRTVPVRFAEETSLPVFDLDGPVERDLRLVSQVPLPVFEGQPLGTVRFAQGDLSLTTATVVAAASVASALETVGAVPVSDYLDRTVVARAGETSSAVLRFDPGSPVERKVMLDQQVSAPIAVGAPLGEVVYWQSGQEICRVPVVAASAVEAPGPVARLGIWMGRAFRGLVGAPGMAQLEIVGS